MQQEIDNREIDRTLQQSLLDDSLPSLIIGALILLVSSLMIRDSVPDDALLLWSGSLAVLFAIRIVLVLVSRGKSIPAHLMSLYCLIMTITGALWGSVMLLWSAEMALVDQLILVLIPVLLAVGAILSLASWPAVYIGFVGGLMLSMIFSISALANEVFARLLIPLVMIASGCVYCTLRLYSQKRETLTLRLQNQRALRSKEEFLSRMSHELRTPMNGVLGMVRMLDRTTLNEEQRVLTRTLRQSGEDMMHLVSDLMDAASLASHDLALHPEACDPRHLLQGQLERLQDALDAKGLTLQTNVDDTLPGVVLLDPQRWQQIASKVLENAVNFTRQGGIQVELRRDDGALLLQVRDTGCGIEAHHLDQIIEPFHQVQGDSGQRVGGIGMGLTIARSLVVLMQGTLHISSTPGEGSCVSIRVPLLEPAPTVSTLARSEPTTGEAIDSKPLPGTADELPVPCPEPSSTTEPAGPRTMSAEIRSLGSAPVQALVAEDNPVNQLVIEASLEELGCEVTLVDDGRQAVQALQQARFDIVFMDCQMPELDGFEATRELRKSGCRLPIIAVTANAVAGDRERCLEVGMNDHVAKPMADDALARMLAKWLPRQSVPESLHCAA